MTKSIDELIAMASAQCEEKEWQVQKLKRVLEQTIVSQWLPQMQYGSLTIASILDDVLALDPKSHIPSNKTKSMVRYALTRTYAKLEDYSVR